MAKETQLEVGDVLFYSKYGNYSNRTVIERVTATQAIGKSSNGTEYRVKRKSSGGFRPIGTTLSGWFVLATPEIEAKNRKNNLEYKLGLVRFDALSLEQLEQIYAIVYPGKTD